MINLFEVGVHVGMTTNAHQVLATMLSHLTGVHVAAGKLEGALGSITKAALGAGAVFAGWGAIKGIWHLVEDNRELNKELEKTRQLGGDFAKNIDNTRAAAVRAQLAVPTSTLSGNVRMAREIGTTIGKPDAAGEMIPEAAKAAYVISHFTGENEEEITKNLMRTADARAQIYTVGADGKEHVDPAKLMREMNALARGLILGGGFLKSSDQLQMARQGGAAVKAMTPEVFSADMTEAAIAMGASKVGTAETGFVQQFVGGTMTKKVAEHLTEAGLLKAGEWHSGNSGGVVVNPQAAQRFEGVARDPVAWLTAGEGGTAIKQYAAKNGIDTMMAIFQLFGRQTVQRLVSEITSNEPQFARAREIYGGIPSVDEQYKELQKGDLDTNVKSIAASWKSFKEAFSDAATPAVIPILQGLTSAIQFFMKTVADHPTIAGLLIDLAGGIAALTALGGGLVVFNTAMGPFIGGLRLLTGVSGIAATGTAVGGLGVALGGLAAALAPFLIGGAAIVALDLLIGKLHDLGQFGNKDGFVPLTGGPQQGVAPVWHGPETRPSGYAPMPGDSDFRIPAVPPPASNGTGQRSGDIYLDGKKVGMILDGHTASSLSRPPTGRMGPDYRISPAMPGMVAAG